MTREPTKKKRSTHGLEDPEDEQWYQDSLRHMAMVTLNEPLSLEKALDRFGFMFEGLIAAKEVELLRETVLSSECPLASDVVQDIESRLEDTERVSTKARFYAASAWIDYVLATAAKARGEELISWYHLSNAQYNAGRFDADYVATRKTLQKKLSGRAGGEKTSRIRDPLMRRCLEQLIKRRPRVAGWRSHEKAFATIAPDLLIFNDTLEEPLTEVELKKKVLKWLNTREDFQRAYSGEVGQQQVVHNFNG